jgi:hypothetical protein
MRSVVLGAAAAFAFVAVGCASSPASFVRVTEAGWSTVEVAPGLNADDTWQSVVDILARKFDLEMINKESGYIRTAWSYTWTGERVETYRVRATVKFTPKRDQVQIRSEAEYGVEGSRIMGTDDRLLTTLKTDIAGVVARTTR